VYEILLRKPHIEGILGLQVNEVIRSKECYIAKSFIICTLHIPLLRRPRMAEFIAKVTETRNKH